MKKIEMIKVLRRLGLGEGDHVILHSALSSIGHVLGGADTVVDAFLEVVGETGTLVVPTFGSLGIITDTVKNRPDAVESIHPLASVAAIGAKAEEFCTDHWKAPTAHGAGTPYHRLSKQGGTICLLGVDHDRNTTLHTVEALLKLPYLSRTGKKTFDTPEGKQTKSWSCFPGPHRDFIGLDRMLIESGKQKIGTLGNATVRLIKSRDLVDLCMVAGRKDPAFVLCNNPNCADCVTQRAAICREQLKRLPFTVVASSRLAGRTLPEMIENLKAAGVDAVEIDAIQGWTVEQIGAENLKRISVGYMKIGADELKKAAAEFRAAGIRVSSVRLNTIPKTLEKIFKAAAAARIRRVVLPLSADAASHIRFAQGEKIKLSFFNTIQSSTAVTERLLGLKRKKLSAGFTFNAASFARAGEEPFLGSFKSKAKRFMDGLDVEDCTYDGVPVELAKGNTEIKELISTLHCGGFCGTLTLSARNRVVTSLRSLVDVLGEWIATPH
ncbi:MAG: AAC(3) family N-acetyltransferase [Holophagae bacterium]|nr:AAC(3) family N-acetyltransferase [Holophagae bacterium]